jgi:glycosyltransferase involved in cell wall biosynthesis
VNTGSLKGHDAASRPTVWLILAHCFNMDGRAASQTITDRLPLLMENRVMPVVLSAPTGSRDRRFPHYQIISPAPSGVLFEMRHIIKARIQAPLPRTAIKAALTAALLPFYAVEKLFIHLDSQWSWFVAAAIYGRVLVRRHRPALIYSTAGPPSTHVAGLLLQRMTGLPWLAEIHDPLVYQNQRPRWQNYGFKRWLEKMIFRHAAAVIYFTENALRSACRRQGARPNCHVLRPGADPPTSAAVYRRRRHLHIGHFGSLAVERHLGPVIGALDRYLKAHPHRRAHLRLDVYGSALDPVSRQALDQSALGPILVEHGRLESDPLTGRSGRDQVLEAMGRCDVLLLIHGADQAAAEYIPSKLYEYLQARRPILALAGPDSELARMLDHDHHRVVDPADEQRIADAIDELVCRWQAQGLADLPVQSPFTIQAAVHRLLAICRPLTDPGCRP